MDHKTKRGGISFDIWLSSLLLPKVLGALQAYTNSPNAAQYNPIYNAMHL